MRTEFFEEFREQSKVKVDIVCKYFRAWTRIMIPRVKGKGDRVGYIDLFAGPGRYEDAERTKSTPLCVLDLAVGDPQLQQTLATWFNDKEPSYIKALADEIAAMPGVDRLRYKPKLTNEEVSDVMLTKLRKVQMPVLYFVDPWGYNGLSLDLIYTLTEKWGCDCIFFFNYNRINMALSNPVFNDNMDSLFGSESAQQLRQKLDKMSPTEREAAIGEAVRDVLNKKGTRHFLSFPFRPTAKTSHHLMFVTKNIKGYDIMKSIMARTSSTAPQGMASFDFNPSQRENPALFELNRTVDDLAVMLLNEFAGRTVAMTDVYREHHIGRPFVEANYKRALLILEAEGKVATDPPASLRPDTLGSQVKIIFPPLARKP
jgi:three-Cys-motif partner protein